MSQTTHLSLQANATVWSRVPGIVSAVETLGQTLTGIQADALKQETLTGYGAAKADARAKLLTAAFTVCSGLKALASAKSDKQLASQVDFSRTDLARGREGAVLNCCQPMLDLGNDNADELATTHNTTAADLNTQSRKRLRSLRPYNPSHDRAGR
ncbi:MAG: hypothetical protein HY043_18470 [Verrucomicrobia bacterium]|nr:hypothetical protein [Verrucomicrobiota bacterium]